MKILGISCFYHDAAAALIEDGVLTAAAQEESYSRKKHDSAYPKRAIEFCLRRAKISPNDLDCVVFYEKPFVKFERLFSTLIGVAPKAVSLFPKAMKSWMTEKLWMRGFLAENLGVSMGKIFFVDHHVSHAASAFFCSPFEEAAFMTVDGVGEWATASWGTASSVNGKNRLEIKQEIRFPHSLGLFYSAFTAFLGFEINEGEYKVMGMAAYGIPRYEDKVRRLIKIFPDGSFELDLKYFAFPYSDRLSFSRAFENIFGKPRDPKARFVTEKTSPYDDPISPTAEEINENQNYADIAASVQKVTEDALVAMAREIHKKTGLSRLCLAGGVALNCVANRRIARETPFREIFIQPAAGDAGGALGAALYAAHALWQQPRRFQMKHAYWGENFTNSAAREALECLGLHAEELNQETLIERAVDSLASGKVIGWFNGRLEWGPRALGHRSILADPRNSKMKDIVNVKIKFREPYRPFAPSVLEEKASDFFEADMPQGESSPYRFMLMAAMTRSEKREDLAAVTHEDGSARIQAVGAEESPDFHQLISCFGQATGVPAVLNTSFNLKGEPIVNTPKEALASYLKSGMDACRLGNFWVEK